jgi:hypothetical protein
MSHRLEMCRVYTRMIPTEMVYFQSIGDRTDDKLIRDPMRF